MLGVANRLAARLRVLREQLRLELAELGRHLHVDPHAQIAAPATMQAMNASLAEHELLARLRSDGTEISSSPSRVGSKILVPRAAWAMEIGSIGDEIVAVAVNVS